MKYLRALRAQHTALGECAQARHEFQGSVGDLIYARQRRSARYLACAAGLGLFLARWRIGSGPVRIGARIAGRLAWHWGRTLIRRLL